MITAGARVEEVVPLVGVAAVGATLQGAPPAVQGVSSVADGIVTPICLARVAVQIGVEGTVWIILGAIAVWIILVINGFKTIHAGPKMVCLKVSLKSRFIKSTITDRLHNYIINKSQFISSNQGICSPHRHS